MKRIDFVKRFRAIECLIELNFMRDLQHLIAALCTLG